MASKSKENKQVAALVYRNDKEGLKFLLLTSRSTKRWILPKGWPHKNEPFSRAAAREAWEEAGIIGKVAKRYIGNYRYDKFIEESGELLPCKVYVHPLNFAQQKETWPEFGQRELEWVTPAEAIERVDERELKKLLRHFAEKKR